MGSKPPRPREGLTLYLHGVSRDRLDMLAEVLNISKRSVVSQAVSRWAMQVASLREPRLVWYVEHPFQEGPVRKGATVRVYLRLPENIVRQVDAFADTLHVPLSAVVEQALLRWYMEDPLVNESSGNGSSETVKALLREEA